MPDYHVDFVCNNPQEEENKDGESLQQHLSKKIGHFCEFIDAHQSMINSQIDQLKIKEAVLQSENSSATIA